MTHLANFALGTIGLLFKLAGLIFMVSLGMMMPQHFFVDLLCLVCIIMAVATFLVMAFSKEGNSVFGLMFVLIFLAFPFGIALG